MCASKGIFRLLFIFVCIAIYAHYTTAAAVASKNLHTAAQHQAQHEKGPLLLRKRRQFDLTVTADHEEDETELALEAIANLWRSADGNTQVEGSAKVVHHTNSLQSGNTSYQARLHVHHDYKKK